jgi:hypothetical protein
MKLLKSILALVITTACIAYARADSVSLLVYSVGVPTLTETPIAGDLPRYQYIGSFNLNLQAIGGDITLGTTSANLPMVSADSFQVYKNGIATNLPVTVSYSQPTNTTASGSKTFVLHQNDSTNVPIAVSFLAGSDTDVYGIMLNKVFWSSAGGKSLATLGSSQWFIGFGPAPGIGNATWTLDQKFSHRTPLVSSIGNQIISSYTGYISDTVYIGKVRLKCSGLSHIYVEIDGNRYLDYSDPTIDFTAPFIWSAVIGTGVHKLVIRGDLLPYAEKAYAQFVGFEGGSAGWTISGVVIPHPIVDEIIPEGIVNLSTRTVIHPNEFTASGFVVAGPDPLKTYPILIRVVGPGLAPFGVQGALADPYLAVFDTNGVKRGENNHWDPSLWWVFQAVGAFPLPWQSFDSAVIVWLEPGAYNVQVKGFGSGTGTALIEAYQLTPDMYGKGG